MRVAIIGGDKRMLFAARAFCDKGADVSVAGFDGLERFSGIGIMEPSEAAAWADNIVLPLPCVKDGRIVAPFSERAILPHELLSDIGEKRVFCGMKERLTPTRCRVYDYASREDFAYRNAILTAEGAIQTAMSRYEGSIFGCRALVLGMGRIGRVLSQDLSALHADVTVAARKESDRAYVEALGMTAADYSLREKYDYDLIFNTVPAMVLPADVLSRTDERTVIIDLASAPGGVDFDYARRRSLTAVHALSLPGRCAPAAAGRIIQETIINIIKEEDGEKEDNRLCDDGVVLHL